MSAERFNAGKPKLNLITPRFINGVGGVLTYGAIKYDEWNWIKSKGQEDHQIFRDECFNSLLRHLMELKSGEEYDVESGCGHIYHVATNAMFIAEYDES